MSDSGKIWILMEKLKYNFMSKEDTYRIMQKLEELPATNWGTVLEFVISRKASSDPTSYKVEPNLNAVSYIFENHTEGVSAESIAACFEIFLEHFYDKAEPVGFKVFNKFVHKAIKAPKQEEE